MMAHISTQLHGHGDGGIVVIIVAAIIAAFTLFTLSKKV